MMKFLLLASLVACAASLDFKNPLTVFSDAKDKVSELLSDFILVHVVPLQFLDKVPLPAQIEFYSTFLNKDIKKGDKHDALVQWAAKNGVPQEMADSYETYSSNMHEVNNTLVEMLSEKIPTNVDKIFSIFSRDNASMSQDAADIKTLVSASLIDSTSTLTKVANLMGFNVAPGLIAYTIVTAGGNLPPIDPSTFYSFIDVNRLLDLSFLNKVSATEKAAFMKILLDQQLTKADKLKQISTWADKNKVTDDVKKSEAAFEKKMVDAKGLITGFLERALDEHLPKIGDSFASQELTQAQTTTELGDGVKALAEDYIKTHLQFASLVGLKPPFGPPAPPTLPGALGKIFG